MSDDTITNDIETQPQKGTPEYNEIMAARYDQQNAENVNAQAFEKPTEITPLPDGGLDKFYNKESGTYDWPNHVRELEYRLEQKSPAASESTSEATEEQSASLDWDAITADVGSNNTLSDDHRSALNNAGIPDDVIDQYLDLMTVGQEYAQQRTIEYAGGDESLNSMFDWARTNLSEEEVTNYNDILDSPNWRMAIDSLRVASGIGGVDAPQRSSTPRLVEGEVAGVSGQAFASKQQMIEAMSDPRYKSDPAFRQQVRLRVGRSNF